MWGSGPGGRRWQRWLSGPGTGGYAEIQSGLARTQLEHVRLEAEAEFSWLESYGPVEARPGPVHGDWPGARDEVAARLADALPREAVDAAYEAWLGRADAEPGERLATGSGWGALEVLRAGYSCRARPSRSRRSAPSRSRGSNSCTAGPFPSRARWRRRGPRSSPGTGATCWRRRPRARTPNTTWESPSGTRATARRPSGAGSAAWNSRPRAGRCCAAWPSPTGRRGTTSGPPTGTPRPSTTSARSGATTASPGRRRRPPWAGRPSPRCSTPAAPRRPARSGGGCTRRPGHRAASASSRHRCATPRVTWRAYVPSSTRASRSPTCARARRAWANCGARPPAANPYPHTTTSG
ncbi:hypothetical protein SALBM135S_06347 [Streptomyces alboniger]